MSDAGKESRRVATRSGRNNAGAVSSSSSSSLSSSLRVVASTVTEPTLNMPTTPAQLTEMIASAVANALTNQQPLIRDLSNAANSESSSIASIGTETEKLGGSIIRPATHETANLYRQTTSIADKALKRNRLSDSTTDKWQLSSLFSNLKICWRLFLRWDQIRSYPLLIRTDINHAGVLPLRSSWGIENYSIELPRAIVTTDEVLTRLLASAGAAPINRTVKIHSMKSKTTTPICFRFQVNKCPFGD